MYNKIILVGNLTRDIDLKYTQGGMAISKTAIATSRKFKSNIGEQKEEVCFVDITFFARSAEVANQYLHKGSKILIEGRLQFDQWNDQNGQKKSKHSVIVDVMQMLDSKATASVTETPASGPSQNTSTPQYETQKTQQPTFRQAPTVENLKSIDILDEDIPF